MNPEVYQHLFSTCNDDQLQAYFGLNSSEELEKKKENYSKGFTMFNKSFTYFQLFNKETEMHIGWCGFHTWYIQHSRAEIGYTIWKETDRGKGYMKEALPPIIHFGFNNVNLHRIEAFIGPDNTPSINLVKSLGFEQEGYLREHYYTNNRFEDSIVFSLLRSEYK
jgi:ribosomal-protein-alanine N-acetyltransferase